MKNRVNNYHTKASLNQTKRMVDNTKHPISETLHNEAMNELKKIYWYEKELLIVVPILMRSATTFELVESLTLLSNYAKEHVELLENKFPEIAHIQVPEKKYNAVTNKNIV
ncbi:hypothetical protein L1S35_08050 [Flavobacterium sp. AS60]|uniref:hypothetical protein n=1 Tax=Flavobacterium anseongense TaxID=2910677 RepID=UPI001F1EA0BA|nr:hypothetical protein [Flavobacterium sp. AS60]MCF6129621.1 hypothetical protein [Flavobacterium sp. AS60]